MTESGIIQIECGLTCAFASQDAFVICLVFGNFICSSISFEIFSKVQYVQSIENISDGIIYFEMNILSDRKFHDWTIAETIVFFLMKTFCLTKITKVIQYIFIYVQTNPDIKIWKFQTKQFHQH